MPRKTVPTGWPSCSVGPATPVVDTAQVAPSTSRAPVAIAPAHSSLTTPYLSTSSAGTPSTFTFTDVA
jgi:hypothetical protein